MSHNSDLPLHWKVSLRRAFNARVNELCGFASIAGPLVREQLMAAARAHEAAGHHGAERLAEFLELVEFEDLFRVRSAEDCVAEVAARRKRVSSILVDMDSRERLAACVSRAPSAAYRNLEGREPT